VLASLFGDIGADKKKRSADEAPDEGFAATAILESVATEVNARGQMVDRHSHDLVVSGSPAQAIREHFAQTRADLDTAAALITLLDPAGVWASGVIKALSDAGGRPVERLHLREQATLRTLATIERTTLVRRNEGTLRIYHADVRAPGSDNAEIPIALMERSHMTAVIVDPLQPHAIDALLQALHHAVSLPTWRCPNLLFMLPPNAVWIANKVKSMAWPGGLRVELLSESMTGASSVWNAMLGVWNQLKPPAGSEAAGIATLLGTDGFPIKVSELADSGRLTTSWGATTGSGALFAATAPPVPARPSGTGSGTVPATARSSRGTLDPARTSQALTGMRAIEGLLGCAVVDTVTGLVLAHESHDGQRIDMELAAAACAQVMRSHRVAARRMGWSEPVDEVMASAGSHQQVMRSVTQHPDLFLLMLLDRQRANLALARFQLLEVERGLG
jgi:predicted regulator of Ras-like GTPase activity (Roadblock/LC7/MglB family)